ncbi:MAG: LLM class flavin-dependent oxidoreductase [Pseudomonadota bacterium]
MQTHRPLGIVLSTVTDAHAPELVEVGALAEQHGYGSVYVNEGRGDALATSLAIGLATESISIGTNIANIYFRHPFLIAHTSRTIIELVGERLVLGLGMSHRGMLASLGIDMGNARETLESYATTIRNTLAGKVGTAVLGDRDKGVSLPIYLAANTSESAALAGRVGDGFMPFLSPRKYIPTLVTAFEEPRTTKSANQCVMSIPTFLSVDREAARSAARYNLAFLSQLPNYRRQWRRAGFIEEMNSLKAHWESGGTRRDAAGLISEHLVDEVCVFGTADDCLAQLESFRSAGVTEPVLAVSPVNEERLAATRGAIKALAPSRAL